MKKRISLLILILIVLFSGCHKKTATKATRRQESIKQSTEAVKISEEDPFDFTLVDTENYYLGEIDDSTYIFKVDKIRKNGLNGRYYSVGRQAMAEAHRFDIEYKDNEYLFCTQKGDFPIDFDIHVDTTSIIGTFSNDFAGLLKRSIAFEVYRAPAFHKAESSRYKIDGGQNLPFTVNRDVVYGQTRWYWASNPAQNAKYAKIIMKGMAKTIKERDVELTMDIYCPNDSCRKRPLLVLIHGGAFYVGDKAEETMTTWCENFVKSGYVVASINYRMGFKISKQSIQKCGYGAIQDAHAAVRYLVANADKYNIDLNYIFLGGASAGAITALGVTFMTNPTRPSFVFDCDLDETMGNLEASTNNCKETFKIRALANMWGAVYSLDELNGHNVPVISFHGTEDDIVPYNEGFPFADIRGNVGEKLFDKMYGSKAIHGRLDSLRVRNELHPIEGVGHAPYEDRGGRPNSTYFFIQDRMQNFFYYELTKTGGIHQDKSHPQHYTFQQNDVTSISWATEGGFILGTEGNSVTVLWRKDAPEKILTVSGTRENCCTFEKSIKL